MTNKKQKLEITHKADGEIHYCSELDLQTINFSVLLRSNRENEDLDYLSSLGLDILVKLKKIEEQKNG